MNDAKGGYYEYDMFTNCLLQSREALLDSMVHATICRRAINRAACNSPGTAAPSGTILTGCVLTACIYSLLFRANRLPSQNQLAGRAYGKCVQFMA